MSAIRTLEDNARDALLAIPALKKHAAVVVQDQLDALSAIETALAQADRLLVLVRCNSGDQAGDTPGAGVLVDVNLEIDATETVEANRQSSDALTAHDAAEIIVGALGTISGCAFISFATVASDDGKLTVTGKFRATVEITPPAAIKDKP